MDYYFSDEQLEALRKISERPNSDYELVPENFEKLNRVYEYAKKLVDEQNGRFFIHDIDPHIEGDYVDCRFKFVNFNLQELEKALQFIDGVSICQGLHHEIFVSFSVDGVYRLKSK